MFSFLPFQGAVGGNLLPLFSLFFFSQTLFSQQYHTLQTTVPNAREAYEDGSRFLRQNDAARALRAFEQALRADSLFIEARLAWAEAHFDNGHWDEAERGFEMVLRLHPSFHPSVPFNLALAEWRQDKFMEAHAHIDHFLQSGVKNPELLYRAQRLADNCLFAAEAVKNPVPYAPRPVGDGVNSLSDEYLPALTADGSTMIFTRRDGYDENFYSSSLQPDGSWGKAVYLDGVNTTQNEGAQAISADGSWLVFTACDRREDGSQGSCDLYWSQLKDGAWAKPVPFSKTINSEDWDAQPSISPDGKMLFFSSTRPGGQGGRDLWFCSRLPGGRWTTPANLGPEINSRSDEQTPFVHPDGQTLYFTSDGLPGMGEKDLYFVRRNPDGSWGRPQNLGYPVNTRASEGTLTVSLDGKTAYFASHRDKGRENIDIYQFEMPPHARPAPVTYVKARVTDASTGNALVAQVEFLDLRAGQPFASARTRPDGSFLVCLPAGRDYALNVSKEKYLFHSENFNLIGTASFNQPFLLDIALQPIAGDEAAARPAPARPVVLRNVFFETGSAALLPQSTSELDRLTALLNETPSLRIQISGHTDNIGDEPSNQALAENRAHAVYEYLIQHGIAAERLRFKGFGETKPIDTNDTPEGRQRNRRTEFVVW
ncbi:MAG: PD40 domain-containing protein [Saprospirales bacterium]|nr:PD40 domain-containing protein [Saprospirales bacterium]MBK8921554.1 PD40 domain-containing protein [Saprospirales bacterium]